MNYGPELATAVIFFVLSMLARILYVGWWLPQVKKKKVPSPGSKTGIMTLAASAVSLAWLVFSLFTGITMAVVFGFIRGWVTS